MKEYENLKGNNCYLVRIDQEMENEEKGFFFDPAFDPTKHARIYGEIVAVPRSLGGKYKDLKQIGEVGDKLYYHFLVVSNKESNHVYDNIWMIEPFNVLAIVKKDGTIMPFGNWFMSQPVWDEKVEEIEMPGGSTVKGVVDQRSGLVTKTNPKPSAIRAKVTHILDFDDAAPGDIVHIQPPIHFTNKIEGDEYYFSEKEYILGKGI